MKKILIIIMTIMIFCTAILFVGCETSTFKKFKNSIIENGEKSSVDGKTVYSVELSNKGYKYSTSLNYYKKDNSVQLSTHTYNDGASADIYIYIDSKLSGKYNWSFNYYSKGTFYRLGGTFYVDRVTATNVERAFVEDINKRSDNMTTQIAVSALSLAKTLGAMSLEDFENYIVYQTDLRMSDFGYNS